MKTTFDPLPHLETYFKDIGNPNPDPLEVLKAVDTVRVALDSPEWSTDLFLLSCLEVEGNRRDPGELAVATRRCVEESLWLRDHLPSPWKERIGRGEKKFIEKNLALPELKKLSRTLHQDEISVARVQRSLEKLVIAAPLGSSGPLHQPTMILRHVLAQRLLVHQLFQEGLDKTLDLLHKKWLDLRAKDHVPADKLLEEMKALISKVYSASPDLKIAATGAGQWSILGEVGEVLGWLHQGPGARYELTDEYGLPVAYHVRRNQKSDFIDDFGLSIID